MSREKYIVSENNYNIIKQIHKDNMRTDYQLLDNESAVVVEDVDAFLSSINDEILMFGLDGNYKPTEYGDGLYQLYDEIYFNDNPIEMD